MYCEDDEHAHQGTQVGSTGNKIPGNLRFAACGKCK